MTGSLSLQHDLARTPHLEKGLELNVDLARADAALVLDVEAGLPGLVGRSIRSLASC